MKLSEYKSQEDIMLTLSEELYKSLSNRLHGSVSVLPYQELITVQINVYAIHYNKALFKSVILETLEVAPSMKEYVNTLVNIIMDNYCTYICDRFFK